MKIIDIIKKSNLSSTVFETDDWREILALMDEVTSDFTETGFLSHHTFFKILEFRSDSNNSQMKKIINSFDEKLLKSITECYNNIEYDDILKYRIKLHILTSIPWIGIGVASSILALHESDKFCLLNNRTWSKLYSKEKKSISVTDYERYVAEITTISNGFELNVFETEFLISKL